MEVLKISQLNKSFGSREVLKDFSLTLCEGQIYGLVGENGSGKSTLLRIIMGLERYDSGDIYICGQSPTRKDRSVYGNIGYVPDQFGVYHNLTVFEYMMLFAQTAGMSGLLARKRIGEVLGLTNLYGYEQSYIERLSVSIRQRMCIAASLLHNPSLLIMDGPAKGIDSENRKRLKELYRLLSERGKAILVTSHIIPELAEFCTDIGILQNGAICEEMPMEKLRKKMSENMPILIKLGSEPSIAAGALRSFEGVISISSEGNILRLVVEDGEGIETEILKRLLNASCTVLSFTRESMDLESHIIQKIEKEKQKS